MYQDQVVNHSTSNESMHHNLLIHLFIHQSMNQQEVYNYHSFLSLRQAC